MSVGIVEIELSNFERAFAWREKSYEVRIQRLPNESSTSRALRVTTFRAELGEVEQREFNEFNRARKVHSEEKNIIMVFFVVKH